MILRGPKKYYQQKIEMLYLRKKSIFKIYKSTYEIL